MPSAADFLLAAERGIAAASAAACGDSITVADSMPRTILASAKSPAVTVMV
jgi:hypothetical protein